MPEVKTGEVQQESKASIMSQEKVLKEVLDSAALSLYGHWIGNGMQKYELNESNPKRREIKKSR